MPGNKELSIVLICLAAIIALVSLVAPWWTIAIEGDGVSLTERAGPFVTNDEMITTTSALLTGILLLVGLLGITGAAGLIVYSLATGKQDNMTRSAPLLALGGAFVLVVAVVLAIFLYPSESDLGFWDSRGAGGTTVSSYAAWGWYLGIGASVIAIVGTVLALGEREERPIPPTGERSGY